MITILLGSRSGDNSQLAQFLSSLNNASTHENYEVLIKFDDDDPNLEQMKAIVEAAKAKGREIISRDNGESEGFYPGQNIRYIVTPRSAGYGDLHKAYLDLLKIANPRTAMYWVLSDDVIILGSKWDLYLLDAAIKHSDGIFVICPCQLVDYKQASPSSALEICDNYPVWSAAWIGLCGGFGYTFSTDGWTNQLMALLYHEYNIDRRVACMKVGLIRTRGAQDVEGSERWNGIRKDTHEFMLSDQHRELLYWQAKAIVAQIKREGGKG